MIIYIGGDGWNTTFGATPSRIFSTPAMIDNSASYRVFKIGELTRLIAGQLIPDSQESAVNLACTCRHLKEPALSVLWETQDSLHTLLETLPREFWDWYDDGSVVCDLNLPLEELSAQRSGLFQFKVKGDPSPEAWSKVHRYASWMRQTDVDGWTIPEEETFRKLCLNSPPGGWFPALQGLYWCITRSNLPYFDLFLSPNMKRISITISWGDSRVPKTFLPVIASTISALPAPILQLLFVHIDRRGISPAYLKDSLSSVVSRFGPSFMQFSSPAPLSDAAMNHLIHLPRLHTWHTEHPPPDYPGSSLPLVFPPLREFTLGEGAAPGWLSLFKRLGDCVSSTQDSTPLSRVRESLESLNVGDFPNPIIDVSFTSIIRAFRNLLRLNVMVNCSDGQCVFGLNNDNVTELAVALPRLDSLLLGYPCGENTCATTVACLLPISVHCPGLRSLGIHFNTTNLIDDLKSISEDPRFQELRSLGKCTLSCLGVYDTPLTIDESDFETVACGTTVIFPNLERCNGWEEVNWELAEVQGLV